MIKFEEALKRILENTLTLPARKIPIQEAVGMILQEDIRSGIEMPPFDKSAMDGYAVNSLDTKECPVRLKCLGLIQAGDVFTKRLKRGECVKIMTGAPLPKGADSVILVEDVSEDAGFVEVSKPVKKGENVCFRAEDIKRGDRVLEKGKKISPSEVGILATVGRCFVKVIPKPKAAILNTGGEIVPLGSKLARFKIYNTNGPMLKTLLKCDGIKPRVLGIAKDNVQQLSRAIRKGLTDDILLISGGVSMGDYDLIPEVLKNAGVKQIFHKVNIKPGKPLFFGVKNKTVIFGIPGNPVSNFLSYLIFVRPAIRKMMGYKGCKPPFKEGIVRKEFRTKAGRRHFVLVKAIEQEGHLYLLPVESHGSADTLSLSKADGFMMVDEGAPIVQSGSKIKFITWKEI